MKKGIRKIIYILIGALSWCTSSVHAQAPDCTTISSYISGTAYTAGVKVKNNDAVYQCRPWPNSGWCSGASSFYEPGIGTSWADAWTLVGGCADQLPLIVINTPFSAQVFTSFSPITLETTVSPQNGGTIVSVYMELYKDGGTTPYATIIPGFPNGNVTTFNWSPSENGTYLLKVYAENEKGYTANQSLTFMINAVTGISTEKNNQLVLYPNPTTEGVEIKLPENINPQAISAISVSDVYGSLVFTSTNIFTFRDESLKITPGVYVVSLCIGDFIYTAKLVKQ